MGGPDDHALKFYFRLKIILSKPSKPQMKFSASAPCPFQKF